LEARIIFPNPALDFVSRFHPASARISHPLKIKTPVVATAANLALPPSARGMRFASKSPFHKRAAMFSGGFEE
jgi:hypothetical protein